MLRSILTAAVASAAIPSLATAALYEPFAVGDGTGVTYTTGSILGQDGGTGWEPGSVWAEKDGDSSISANGSFTVTPEGRLLAAKDSDSVIVRAGVGREYVVPADPYTLTFDLAVDAIAGLDQGSDYINLLDRPGPENDFGSDGTWMVRGLLNGGATVPTWVAYSGVAGQNTSFNDLVLHDSGIELVAGHDYAFSFAFLGGGEWTVTIDDLDDAETAWTSGTLGFRNNASLPTGYQIFGIRDTDGTQDAVAFSVDNIVIPEPATTALLAAGALMLLPRRRR